MTSDETEENRANPSWVLGWVSGNLKYALRALKARDVETATREVEDAMRRIADYEAAINARLAKHGKALPTPDFLDHALNEGDGSYKP